MLANLVKILGSVVAGVVTALTSSLQLSVGDIVQILRADPKPLFDCIQNAVNYLLTNGIGSVIGLSGLLGAIAPSVGGILSGLLPIVLNTVFGLVSNINLLLP